MVSTYISIDRHNYNHPLVAITMDEIDALNLLMELQNMTRLNPKSPVPVLSDLEKKLYCVTNSSRR